ncbi:hypothetical protein ACHQM5_006413 [Ranunculus cassubicifolius]
MLVSKITAARVFQISPILTKSRFILCSSSFSSLNFFPPSYNEVEFDPKEVALSFKHWFRRRNDTILDKIFEILAAKHDDSADFKKSEVELSKLGLKLNEEFVLKVLNYGRDVLSCLKFFDWAGRQRGFSHTRATFYTIFKILSREKLMSLMLDFLETYKAQRKFHQVRFNDTLVVGYAVAGKPDIALKLFGQMRFQGLDLDPFAYHVFLNALVEQSCYDVVEVLLKQIRMRGLESEITWCIMTKNFCKQNKLKEAADFLRDLGSSGCHVNDKMVSVLIDEHCKRKKFEEAQQLLNEFWDSRKISLENSYAIWTNNLIKAGNLDGALDFLRGKRLLEGYVPGIYRYNSLIYKLLMENRLDDVSDLLMEMMEENLSPDKATMNAALCFFCKAGMVDVALELYYSRSEFGLSANIMSYNYLINTLCGDGSVDEAYRVLKDSIKDGYFPGKKTASILADALCREGKLDKMKELIIMALELNIMPSDAVCVKFISALCRSRMVEDGYRIYSELSGMKKLSSRFTYFDLVRGFNRVNRGDMAARLLIEMQDYGFRPTRNLYRDVICCICAMENPEIHFFKLLEMQLAREVSDPSVYNFFIDGAGHAQRPDLAKEVFEMMGRNGILHNSDSKILMLQSYLKNGHIADALNLYGDLCKDCLPGRRLNNSMVVGLSKANKPGLALEILRDLREKKFLPSKECYEELVQSFCSNQNYDMAVEVIEDLFETGRPVSSYIGNVLLLNSFKSRELYQAWVRSGVMSGGASPSGSLTLGELIGLFSGGFRVNPDIEDLDEIIEQCFPLDIFTYNMLLRRLSMTHNLDRFVELVYKMSKRGYQYNRWTYDIIIHSLFKHGRTREAMRWMDEAHRMGFDLTEGTKLLL